MVPRCTRYIWLRLAARGVRRRGNGDPPRRAWGCGRRQGRSPSNDEACDRSDHHGAYERAAYRYLRTPSPRHPLRLRRATLSSPPPRLFGRAPNHLLPPPRPPYDPSSLPTALPPHRVQSSYEPKDRANQPDLDLGLRPASDCYLLTPSPRTHEPASVSAKILGPICLSTWLRLASG